jgi:DNA-binding transcriptional ArsR family regulator
MVKSSSAALDRTFAALSDPTRRAILSRLANGPANISELAGPFRISMPAISKHIGVLEKAGLLTRERTGRVHRCRLRAEPIRKAASWLAFYEKFWNQQLDRLGNYLETNNDKEQSE